MYSTLRASLRLFKFDPVEFVGAALRAFKSDPVGFVAGMTIKWGSSESDPFTTRLICHRHLLIL
jgi:hypothetical protein